MTSRGTASLLTRATAILAAAFMLNSLVLAILAGDVRPTGSILEPQAPLSGTLEEQGVIGTAPTPDADGPNPAEPAEPDVPLAE
jgi:preprotein translocase subunit SecG